MKSIIRFTLIAFVSLAIASLSIAADSQPARVTLKVVKFRPVTAQGQSTQYTDATMSLEPHPQVAVSGTPENATLHPTAPVDFEISVISATPGETYRPLGIVFQQKGNGQKSDPVGALNFAPARIGESTLTFRDKFVGRGAQYHYEFFVMIQRGSDGAIGIIDPTIIHEGDHSIDE